MARTIQIQDHITVGDLAEELMMPTTELIAELMKNGVMATVNEQLDYDTVEIMLEEMGMDVELQRKSSEEEEAPARKKKTYSDKAQERPPVIAVMGHVDHGKTSLLDAIREADVATGESGGITQHISAYQITHDDRRVTFLDTPGHEAFAALREHGAQLTDLAILVVAADDGIKPQTLEAIRFAQKAGVKMIVAMNKVDKPDADLNKLKQQLADNNLLIEEWGGDTVALPVSAKTKEGIKELLDMVLLTADVEELKADTDIPAEGLVIESHMEKGRGPIAIALVEGGQLKPGDFIVAGATYARVRNLEDTLGNPIKTAGPSTPVIISGFKDLPAFGNEFKAVKNEKTARLEVQQAKAQKATAASQVGSSADLINIMNRSRDLQQLNVIVKADVQGSLTSVIDSLKSLDTKEVAVRVISSGIGAINENDAYLALTSNAIIYGFNVELPAGIRHSINRDKTSVRLYQVIYELIDDVKDEMSKLLAPEVKETDTGKLKVLAVFKTTKTEVICGGEVTKGRLVAPAYARIFRDKEQIAEAEVTNLKRGPQDTKEVQEGEQCGVNLATTNKLQIEEGDRLEVFTREVIERSL
ncbi:MAG: translation initiation factor IF-2 [Candidatus Saccharibacteria bacterium]|nr:translation initiation factor IF-2 [Candidatus Saccharibacteria bacterium]